MNDFGPRLPPHLQKRKDSNLSCSDSDDDLIGPVPAGAPISRRPPKSIQSSHASKKSKAESETVDSPDQQESLMEQHLRSKTSKTVSRLESIRINPNFVAKRNDIIQSAKSLDSKFTKKV